MTLILSNDDVARLLTVPDCIAAMEQAYADLARGKGVNRVRSDSITGIASRPEAIYGLKTMDGIVPRLGVGAVRINSDVITWPMVGNSQRRTKVPAANGRWVGLVLIFSCETGEPLAIMPDGVMQRIRVASTNGIAMKYMARADASEVAIIGSGWQAGTLLAAAASQRQVKRIRCWSPTKENRERFSAAESETLGITVEPMDTPEAAVAGAHIVICATSAIDPVFMQSWLEPGVHISTIKKNEIDAPALGKLDRIVLHQHDEKPIIAAEPGAHAADSEGTKGWGTDLGIDFNTLPTVFDLVTGAAKGRDGAQEKNAFLNNLGMGYQFAVAGAVVVAKAKAQGIGHALPTEWFTEDVHP